jgi:hypothetical protein
MWQNAPKLFVGQLGKMLDVEKVLYFIAGALTTFTASWFLQNRAFKRERLDRTREKVYGPLSWELNKMHHEVSDLEFNPSRQEADRIRLQEHLEWMIESKELRTDIAELYDKHIPNYRDVIHDLVKKIHEKLTAYLVEQVKSTFPQIQAGWSQDKQAIIKTRGEERMRDIHPHVGNLVHGLAWPLLRAALPDQEEILRRRSYYQNLIALASGLKWSSFDDYFAEATKMCDHERVKAEEAKKNLLEKIEKIQRELEELLKPD